MMFFNVQTGEGKEERCREGAASLHTDLPFHSSMKTKIKSQTADILYAAGAKSYLSDWQFQKASTGVLLVITSWEMSSH